MAGIGLFLSAIVGLIVGIVFLAAGYSKFSKSSSDNTLSWANVQVVTWTGVVLGSYIAIALLKGNFPDSIPNNLLALMGVSIGTQAGSKLTRAIQGTENVRLNKPAVGVRGLMAKESDPSQLNVAKLQHLAWTVVGVIVYLIALWNSMGMMATLAATSTGFVLPDVGNGLPVLMGISASGYIANKIGDQPPQNSHKK
jgi:hypothetical protein